MRLPGDERNRGVVTFLLGVFAAGRVCCARLAGTTRGAVYSPPASMNPPPITDHTTRSLAENCLDPPVTTDSLAGVMVIAPNIGATKERKRNIECFSILNSQLKCTELANAEILGR